MAEYKYLLLNAAGDTLGELPAANRDFKVYLNLPGSASFDVGLKYEKLGTQQLVDSIDPWRTYLKVMRDTRAMFGGEIQFPKSVLNASTQKITCPAIGYQALFEDRLTADSITYTGIDQGAIAWALINDSQTKAHGDFGITQGTITTGILRDRTYESKNIKEAIEELAACEDGFDFCIEADKVFQVFYPMRGTQLGNFVFEYGKNIIEVTEDLLKPINMAFVLGAGEGENMLRTTVSDAASISLYQNRETLLSLKDVSEQDTLVERGQDFINENALPKKLIGLKVNAENDPELGSYWLGDKICVKVDCGRMQIDGYRRIYGIEVNIDDDGKEDVTVIVNS